MNMTHLYEIIDYSNEFPVQLFCHQLGSMPPHWHDSIEILLVLSGQLRLTIGTQHWSLSEDDIVLINANEIHETAGEHCILMALQVRPSMFGDERVTQSTFSVNSATALSKRDFDNLRTIIAHLVQLNASQGTKNIMLSYAHLYGLMHELMTRFRSNVPGTATATKQMARLRSILDYINENYMQDISLADIASREFMNPSYLSHFFEKHMGISFGGYLTKIRLESSMHSLIYTDQSIESIAETYGFASARAYADQFRKQMGVLPSKYRQNMASGPNGDVSAPKRAFTYINLEKYDYMSRLAEYLKDDTAPITSPRQTKLRYPLGRIHLGGKGDAFTQSYRVFCSVGKLHDVLYEPVRQMLRTMQEEIGFRYIKFHGIFDDNLMVYREDEQGQPVFNFAMVDQALDFLLSIRLKPLIQLSFMPRALAKNPQKHIYYVPFYLSVPKDEDRWTLLVTRLTEHLRDRYGMAEVASWPFTFWNETLNGFPFDMPRDTVLRLYESSYRAVKAVCPEACFASMSYSSMTIPGEPYDAFLAYADEHDCQPDAYILHFYPMNEHAFQAFCRTSENTERGTFITDINLGGLSTDPDALNHCLVSANAYLPQRATKPLHLLEWSLSPSHREWLHDTCFEASYTVRNILQNQTLADSFGHWTLTDWMTEWDFPQDLFHGGMGMFTYNGIKKPVYYAYAFMTQLQSTIIAQGEGYCVTQGNGKIVMLLYNYQHFTDLYANGISYQADALHPYNAFDVFPIREFTFTLDGLQERPYLFTETPVNRQHGSAFDKWIEMGAMPLRDEKEALRLKHLSEPMSFKRIETPKDGTIRCECSLEPHEIRLIVIEPQAPTSRV